ncbi:MarR family winged helix-turn-helix transcriptional regulator [Streptomyces sp. NPDC002667]|uniref:MarR family winged helix-turn-helix transcriptional regulator n=1 Tax=Streptomyces sp. NPDC002667 TaxID=3364657 RepID=UPI0036A3542A
MLAVPAGAPDGQVRMTDIADHLVHSRSGLTYRVARPADAGLVTKASASDDERSTVVTATAQGREALFRALPGHVEVVQRLLLTPLSNQDTAALGDVLGRVRGHLRAQPPRSIVPRKRVPRGAGAVDGG